MHSCDKISMIVILYEYGMTKESEDIVMKRLIAAGLALVMTLSLAACKDKSAKDTESKKETTKEAETLIYNPADYVSLGEYENIPVTITGDYDTSEAAVKAYIGDQLDALGYIEDKSADTVKKDSIVNVDYTGLKDGVAFQGGTATDQKIDVGNNSAADGTTGFIDGFTDGLVGAKVGDTVDCEVTFPEDYSAAELAGQKVVFRFTVNYICKKVTADTKLTDEFVKENFKYDTVEEFETAMKEELEENVNSQKTSDIRSAVINTVVSNATIKGYPEAIINQRKEAYLESYTTQYGGYDNFEAQMKSYGMDMDEFMKEMEDGIKTNLETEMVFGLIADNLGLTLDEDGFKEYCQNMMLNNGVESLEQLYGNYGGSSAQGEAYLRRIYVCNKAVEYCVDHVGEVTIETAQ